MPSLVWRLNIQHFKKERKVRFIHISVTLRWERNTALYSSSLHITKPCLCIENKNKAPERRKNILSFFFIFHSISLKLAFVWSKRREPFHGDLRLIKTVLHRPNTSTPFIYSFSSPNPSFSRRMRLGFFLPPGLEIANSTRKIELNSRLACCLQAVRPTTSPIRMDIKSHR